MTYIGPQQSGADECIECAGVNPMSTVGEVRDAAPELQASVTEFAVRDATFCKYIDRLKELRSFLFQKAVPINLEMGNLSTLYYDQHGRAPTVSEWEQVERQTQRTFLLLTPTLRRQFLMGGTP